MCKGACAGGGEKPRGGPVGVALGVDLGWCDCSAMALPACCLTSGEVSLKNNFAYKLLTPASILPFLSFFLYVFPCERAELHFG